MESVAGVCWSLASPVFGHPSKGRVSIWRYYWLPDGLHLLPPFIAFTPKRETNPVIKTGRLSLGGKWERKKSGVLFRIKLADITLKVIVLLILIRDKSHNGWYQGRRVSPVRTK